MDINAILVASLISGIANPLVNDIAAATNSRIEVKNIMYEGENITFQHSLWKIRNDTVCSSYTTISPDYSSCTVKAKMLFDDLCQYLSAITTPVPTIAAITAGCWSPPSSAATWGSSHPVRSSKHVRDETQAI